MSKKQIRNKVFRYLYGFDPEGDIKTKIDNVCGKTGRYNVPTELWQKRTKRSNRVLISWKTVRDNVLTLEQLETFEGGVVVEFINNDYFSDDDFDLNNPLFNILKDRLGSDEKVSSMISIRTEDGSSSSQEARIAFEKLKAKFPDYNDHLIRRKDGVKYSGKGNDKWEGFIFYSIRGGQQDIKISHVGKVPQLFNPACEYASDMVCLDIDLVLAYFAFFSISEEKRDKLLQKELEKELGNCFYFDNKGNRVSLLDYCKKHPCLLFVDNALCDVITMEKINIEDFADKDRNEDTRTLDLTHDEAVNKDKFYFDKEKNMILSAARPTNMFWSKKLSNMMQQNFSIEEFFAHEEAIVERRKEKLKLIRPV